MENRLYSYLSGIAKSKKSTILNINGMNDQIHLVIHMHQDVALSTSVKETKSYITGWIKKRGYTEFSWEEGYGSFSCSKSLLDPLLKYVENQKQQHKKFSFKEEIEMLENKMGIKWFKN